MTKNKIAHFASFARSGETLMLRCLNEHPGVHIVHQLLDHDTEQQLNLFKFLMDYEPTEIENDHELVSYAGVKENALIVLKSAVWTHAYPHNGFILVRNPFSIINSFKIELSNPARMKQLKSQLVRWGKRIDSQFLPAISRGDFVGLVCMLYNLKMGRIFRSGLPIVRYEDFVSNPENVLRKLLPILGLDFDPSVLRSHESYKEGVFGHGNIPLWQPINAKSLTIWKKLPPDIIATIYGITSQTMESYGYRLVGGNLTFDNSMERLVM